MTAYYQLIQRDVDAQGCVTAHYHSTNLAQGAWNAHEQHMAPATGIICAELDRFSPRHDMRIGRISLDILGLIPAGEFEIITQVIRPGKTIELIESEMRAQGKTCIVARTWRMMTQNSQSVKGLEDADVTGPETAPIWDGIRQWPGGYIQSIEARSHGRRAGQGIVWLRTQHDMVEGEPTADFVRLMGMVDTANGIVPRQDWPFGWGFPNLDLQIHLHRLPQGQWLGLETVQQYGADGVGLSSSVLHDVHGPFGRSEQILTLRPLGT
ncbi:MULTISPECIES: thioesterase family protein [Acinetobacter]|uniref:thioesterase family protein n=1 Tax=Acinetobacter TaxID=469 RepID=UPI000992673F|nr:MULTISPECIES: thioesterase family protein [Acinetobacter]MCL6238758.1 thioesterase family protein [Acinetobacter amyesii]MCL6242711.1 thioesterase family protein [Acinetobacter amyesii]MCL6245622.1 thioesterase family protein [Acinetobacter amyesii]OOV82230.1 thioesterase [Acinetobacter sp. ANC 5600]QOW50461.1 thioesterase family protein [Acinetobacter sp. YH12138]